MEWRTGGGQRTGKTVVLTLDGEKKFEIPELTLALMERLAGYTLVGFHVKPLCPLPEKDGIVAITPAGGEDRQVAVRARYRPVEPVAAGSPDTWDGLWRFFTILRDEERGCRPYRTYRNVTYVRSVRTGRTYVRLTDRTDRPTDRNRNRNRNRTVTVPYRTVPYRTVPYRSVPTVPYRTVPYRTVPYLPLRP